jgi:4-amino-4-deoxychorismate lyase
MGRGIVQIGIPGSVPDGVTVFETMRAEVDGRIALLPLHLARLRRGCAALNFPLDRDRVTQTLATLPRGNVLRARLAVDHSGGLSLTHMPLPPAAALWRVTVSQRRLDAADPWLTIKSSHRPVYDAARAELPPGIDEALLLNTDGALCEGTITTVFLERDGLLLTPPQGCGLLPGVLRADLLRSGRAIEHRLSLEDLRQAPFFVGNALRGLIPAVLV